LAELLGRHRLLRAVVELGPAPEPVHELTRELLSELPLQPPPGRRLPGLEHSTDESTVAQQALRAFVLGGRP